MDKTELVKLVQKAAEGDAQAFSVLYEEYYDKIYYLSFKLLQNSEEASDIAQETFITAFESIKTLKNAFAFEGWLKTIASNKCKNHFKKAKPLLFSQYENEDTVELIIEDTKVENAVEIIDNAEIRRIINDIIDHLPDEQRVCVMLYYFDEKPIAEIAEFMECSEGTVKSRLNYARKKIKEEIEAIEKKDDIKLHSAVIIPLLGAILSSGIPNSVGRKGFISVLNGTAEIINGVTNVIPSKVGEIQSSLPKSDVPSAENTKSALQSSKKSLAQKLFKTTASKVVAGVLSATILVSGGMYAGSRLNSQPESPAVNTEQNTAENVPENTTEKRITSLDSVSNIIVSVYDITEPDNAGFAGIIVEFDPVENADGYVIRYVDPFDESSHHLGRLTKEDTSLFFGTQSITDKVDIRPYKEIGNGDDIIYGEWSRIYDPFEHYGLSESLNYAGWDAATAGCTEIYP